MAETASATIGAASARDVKGGDGDRWLPHQADAPNPLESADYKVFTADEAAFVEARPKG
ncbi:hypothetical protein X738_27705 [Mesorhizobium sp. LNHC209A00]|nr:hypothetical protein X738_27705 [Mesorhizobium sp. LNHC209A00]